MEHHETIPFLREAVIFLASAGVVVPIFHRLKVNPVLGFLLIGGIIGPFGLGLWADEFPLLSYIVISDHEGVSTLAELGVIFLLFMIGLELSLDRLWAMRRMVFGLGGLQILITGTVVALIAAWWGNTLPVSIVLGACFALSSTAIVMGLLTQSRRVATPLGRTSFSILLMQDLAVVPILFAVGVFGASAGGNVVIELLTAVGTAVLAIAGIYVLGRLVVSPLLRFAAQPRSREVFMAAVLLTVIGTAALTGAAGLSMALGAFLAGLVLCETEYRHEVEVDIEPFKGLMMGLFFMSVGMGVDWRLVIDNPLWIISAVVGLFAIKSTIITGLCFVFGTTRAVALEAGLLLGQGGEFAFIVVGLAMSLGLMGADVGQFMLIVAGVTMLVTPLVATGAEKLGQRFQTRDEEKTHAGQLAELGELEGHVILAGFGRVGRTLANVLDAEAVPYIALDANPQNVKDGRDADLPVFFGDAGRLELLRRAHVDKAQAVVVTMNAPLAVEHIVREIRKTWPHIPVFARASDKDHAARLIQAGATSTVPETVEASLQLAGRVLGGLGVSEDVVLRRLNHQRTLEEN